MGITRQTFSDLDLDFIAHPVTADLVKKKNEEAVKRALRNIINLQHYEKPFNPQIGSGVRDLLFEPATSSTASRIRDKIAEVVENFEPRVTIFNIVVSPTLDSNAYDISIEFYIKNIDQPASIEILLKRLR